MLGGHLGGEQNWPLWSGEAPLGGLSTCPKRTRHTGSWWGGAEKQGPKLGTGTCWTMQRGSENDCSFLAWAVGCTGGPNLNQTGKGEAKLVLGVPTRGWPGTERPGQRQMGPQHSRLHSWTGWA